MYLYRRRLPGRGKPTQESSGTKARPFPFPKPVLTDSFSFSAAATMNQREGWLFLATIIAASESEIRVEPLTSFGFGRLVTGISDVSRISKADILHLKELFLESDGLLVVRTGAKTHDPAAVKSFARCFGELEDNEKYYRMGMDKWLHPHHREILCVGNALGERSMLVRVDEVDPLLWHCDDSFRIPQPMGSCFYCVRAPAKGPGSGATHFACGVAALAALPDSETEQLRKLVAVHDYNYLNELLRAQNPDRPKLSDEVKAATPPVLRPLVATHPCTGKESLFVPGVHISRILDSMGGDIPRDATVERLVHHATDPRFEYAHEWEEGDCLFWDNRCTLHAPSHLDAKTSERLMWRITIWGDEISPTPAELHARLDR